MLSLDCSLLLDCYLATRPHMETELMVFEMNAPTGFLQTNLSVKTDVLNCGQIGQSAVFCVM